SQLLEEKVRELLDCHDQLEVAREAEEEYERRLDEEEAKGRRRVHALEDELRAEQTVVAQLREEAARANDRGGAAAQWQREQEQLRAEVERLGQDLLKESSAAEQAGLDLEVLTEELELERRKNRDLPHEIRLAEAHKAEALEAKASAFFVKALTSEVETEKQRYSELEERKDHLEEQLQEVENWKNKYEEGHGLVDAVQFQKKLKNDLHRLETELEQRSLKMGEVMDANAVLTMTCQRLKEEAGKPEDFSYGDLAAVKKAQAGEVARMTAVAAELQTQVDDLNDERVRLLKKLRDGAGAGSGVPSQDAAEGRQGDDDERRQENTSSDSEAAQLSEAVKRLALEISRRDAQIEKLERSLLSLGGNDATFTERGGAGAGDPTAAEVGTNPASLAAAAAAAATTPGGAAVASPRASSSDDTTRSSASASAGGNVAEGGAGVLPSREELDQLTKENRSLREALTAMAVKSVAGDAHATAGDGSGKPTPVDGGAEEAGAKEHRVVEEMEASSKLQQEAADKRVEQLTRVNETIMRQLQTLMARKDSPREAARRASRAVGGGRAATAAAAGGDKDKDKSEPAAAVQADMQRLIVEMGDLRQLVAGGFANKNTAKAARNPGTVPSHPHGVSGDGDGGGVVPGDIPARATTGASRGEAAAGKEVRGMKEDGNTLEEAEGGGSGGSVPAPATGSAEEFREKPQQQGGPKTAQGQEALRWQLRRLNLPPEEWAEDVRNINAQLVEALEQLQAREAELDEHEELIVRW
ncbi:unnamed protein product, partial [Ectocarpus sp. 12 AP-2014]